MALLIPTLGGNKKRKDDLLGSLSNLDVRTNNAVTNQNNGGGLVDTIINKVNSKVESARSQGLIPSTTPVQSAGRRQATPVQSAVSELEDSQNRNVLKSLNNLEIKPTTLSPLDKLNKANGGEQDQNGKMSFDEFKATMTAKNVINQGGTGAPIKASAIKNAQGLNAANSMYDEAHKNEQSTFKSPVRGLKQYTADDSKNYYKDDSLKLNRSLVSNLRNLDDDGSNYDDEHWAHQKMVGQIFKPALNGKENDENYLKGTSYRSLLDSYNNANGDQQADIKKDLSNYIIDLREEAKKSDPDVAAAKLKSISYLSDLNRLLDQYGHDKGKSLGKQVWDWLSTGGFLGDIGGNALEQGLGNITGLGEKTKANIEKTENKRDDLGLVGGVGGTLGAVGNFGLNIATGGAAGAATAGVGGLNTMADADNKVLDFDENGNAIIRKKDIKENLGEFGKSLLDLGFAGAGVKGIGPSLKPSGVTADGLSKLTAKDLAKYALQEAPWAAGTTYGQEALNNLAQNKEDWYNVDAGQFAKDLALNLGQDIGMDAANYRAGKVSDSQAPDANFTQRVKGGSNIEGQAGKVKPELTKPTDELSSVKYTQDGQAVKVNQDGTTTRLSDEELARKATETTNRPINPEQTAIRANEGQNSAETGRIETNPIQNEVIRQQNSINPIRDNSLQSTQLNRQQLADLLTRANNGDLEAKRVLEQYGYKQENQEEQTGWRPKTVEEVIKPEEVTEKAQNAENQNLIKGKNANELGKSLTDLIDKAVDNTTRYVGGDQELGVIRQELQHDIWIKATDSLEKQGVFKDFEEGKISEEQYQKAIENAINASAREVLNAAEIKRLEQNALQNEGVEAPNMVRVEGEKATPETEQRTNTTPTNEMADTEPMLTQKEAPQNVMSDTRISDALANMGSENEKATFGERLADNVKALNDVLTGKNRLQPAYALADDAYSYRPQNSGETPSPVRKNTSFAVIDGGAPDGTNLIVSDKGDVPIPENATDKEISKIIKDSVKKKFQGNTFPIGDTGKEAFVNKNTKKELGFRKMPINDFRVKGEAAQVYGDLLRNMSEVKETENLKPTEKPNVDHYIEGKVWYRSRDDRLFRPTVYIEVGKNGNYVGWDLAYFSGNKNSQGSRTLSSVNHGDQPVDAPVNRSTSSISQTPETVNPTQSRFAQNTATNRNFSDETRKALKTDPVGYKPVTNEERLARANEILSTKSIDEIDNYLRDNYFNVKDNDRNSGDAVLAAEFAKQLDARGQFDRSTEVINKMSEIGTKQGQNIQALSLMMNRSPEGIANMAQTAIKKGGGQMTGELRGKIVEKTQAIGRTRGERAKLAEENAAISEQIMNGQGNLKELRKRQMAIAQEYRRGLDTEGRQFSELSDIVGQNSPDNRSVFGSIWRAGLLSGPRTHTGNAVSNTFQNILNAGSDRIASGLDWARAKITGTEREVVGSAGGRGKGLKRGLGAAGEVLKTGNNLWDGLDSIGKTNAWGQGGEMQFKNKVANTMVAKPTNFVFRAMSAGDLPFRYSAFENAVRTEAKRQGINQGYRGQALQDYINSRVATPDPELQAYGIKKGNESVYDADTKLSGIMERVDKFIDGQDNKIVKNTMKTAKTLIAPFVKVPSKVLSTAIDYSPLGSVKAIVNKLGTKGYTTGQFETDLARSGLGSAGFVGLGYALSAAGLLTGGYPDDQNERNRWKAEGIEPNSIKVGDKYISLNYLGPASMLMSMGSGVQQRQANGEDALSIATGTLMDTVNSFLDQSYVQGLSNAVNAITDSQRYGESYVNSFARGLVPNLLRQTATATDPKQRQTNNAGEAIISGIPGLSQTLDAKVDTYGREIENKQTMPLGQMWDAFKISNSRETNEVIDEVRRLHEVDSKEKDLQVTPTAEKNTISVGGEKVKLTDAQRTQLQKDAGAASIAAMSQVMHSDEYSSLSDTQKAEALDKARKSAQKQAREQFVKANSISANNNTGAKESGGAVTKDYSESAIDSATSEDTAKGKTKLKIADNLKDEYKETLKKYKSMSKEKWNEYIKGDSAEQAAAEYNLAKAKYENDVANGKLTEPQKIKRQKELEKMAVSKDWSKSVRDAYSLAGTKADIQKLLSDIEDEGQRAEMVGRLNGLNEAMYNAGLINKSTYNSRGRNINNLAAKKGGSGGKKGRKSSGRKGRSGSGSGSKGITAAEASAMTSAIKALSEGANFGYGVVAPKAPNTGRKMQKTRSSRNNYSQKTYAPKKANITVQKGQQKGVKKK